ncbi:hypothetical protein [Microlunatus parietis]|uniref:Uncharacterized protein n=1 Tax=Microlunatus parietis TaxID=682979 RepID=A0A7Y9I8H3_9ACTN|nr:hypothetical protein [Microlunatus parietis]
MINRKFRCPENAGQPSLRPSPLGRGEPAREPAAVVEARSGHRHQLLARDIGALPVNQEVLPG